MATIEDFEPQLNYIKDSTIREFTRLILSKAPATFWVKPASSTGKYHSPSSLGEGGLARHCRSVAYLCHEFSGMYSDTTDLEHDIVVSAGCVHDLVKYGLSNEAKWTTKSHDIDAARFVRAIAKFYPSIDPKIVEEIASCCEGHMGQWRSDTACKFDRDFTKLQKIVHTADYASSRQKVSVDIFDEAPLIG